MKRLFAVTRTRTEAWDDSRSIEEQKDWRGHADFMDALFDEGVVLLAGPLEGTREALLVVSAEDVASIHARLATDPWTDNLLRTTRVVRWTLRLGTLGDGS
jgi:hypothetical protein